MTETPTRQTSAWAETALSTMRVALDRMVVDHRTPGGVVAAGTVDAVPGFAAAGAVAPGGSVPDSSTLYDVASLTKVVSTWPLVGDALARGLVDLDAPVSTYFPEFAAGSGGSVTVREILTHTSGLMPSTRLDRYVGDPRDVAEAILSEPLDTPAGPHRYINRGFILLGLLLARVNGRSLADLLDGFAAELGTSGLQYGPLGRGAHVAPTERRLVGGEPLQGVVHDENAHTLGGAAGHAGVFASAEALAALARRLLTTKRETGAWAEYVAQSWRPAVRVDDSTSRGLAWLVSDDGLVYHHGFTGTSLYLDPGAGRYLLVLTNAIAGGRKREGLAELRKTAADQLI